MAYSLQLIGRNPANNPDTLIYKVTYASPYAGPEVLNLTPYSGANTGGFTDPGLLGPPSPDRPLATAPGTSDDLGGAYTECHWDIPAELRAARLRREWHGSGAGSELPGRSAGGMDTAQGKFATDGNVGRAESERRR